MRSTVRRARGVLPAAAVGAAAAVVAGGWWGPPAVMKKKPRTALAVSPEARWYAALSSCRPSTDAYTRKAAWAPRICCRLSSSPCEYALRKCESSCAYQRKSVRDQM